MDTNIVIAALNGEAAVLAKLEEARSARPSARELFVPTIVLGELYFGARRSARVGENLRKVSDFAARADVLPCDAETASQYGEVKEGLARRGTPIPENDVWIASLAMQHAMALVARDSHFDRVAGLSLESW